MEDIFAFSLAELICMATVILYRSYLPSRPSSAILLLRNQPFNDGADGHIAGMPYICKKNKL